MTGKAQLFLLRQKLKAKNGALSFGRVTSRLFCKKTTRVIQRQVVPKIPKSDNN